MTVDGSVGIPSSLTTDCFLSLNLAPLWKLVALVSGSILMCHPRLFFLFLLLHYSIFLPTCKAFLTHPWSTSLVPCPKVVFLKSSGRTGTWDMDEYMQISNSLRGNDQKQMRSWTGSGMRLKRSSILWKGMLAAACLAQMSNKLSGFAGKMVAADCCGGCRIALIFFRLDMFMSWAWSLKKQTWHPIKPESNTKLRGCALRT